jgi:hypothetical protein
MKSKVVQEIAMQDVSSSYEQKLSFGRELFIVSTVGIPYLYNGTVCQLQTSET